MRQFVFKVFFFCVWLLALDFTFVFTHVYFYPKDYQIINEEKLKVFDSPPKKVLIIGDSFASDGFMVQQSDQFNFGVYHSTPFDYYHFLKDYLLDSQLNRVVLNLNTLMFTKDAKVSKYYPSFVPSFNYYIESSNKNDFLKFFFQSYRYPISLKYFVKKWVLNQEMAQTRNIVSVHNGYIEFYDTIEETTSYSFNTIFNSQQIEHFQKIQSLLDAHDVELSLTRTPAFFQGEDSIRFEHDFSHLCSELNLTSGDVLDCNDLPFDREDFLNQTHLNSRGALKFSDCIFAKLALDPR